MGFLAALILGCLVSLLRTGPNRDGLYSAVPFLPFVGSQQNGPTFASDGERVAFSWAGDKKDNFDIYVKQTGSDTPLRLTTDPMPDLSPAWSPDGRTIAFVRVSPDRTAEVLTIPSLGGGAERRVAGIQAPLMPQAREFSPGHRTLDGW
jgi:dipeptidyl aminopeptidase/acylaminoacyl peptidase